MSPRLSYCICRKIHEPEDILYLLCSRFSCRITHKVNAQQILIYQQAGFFSFDPRGFCCGKQTFRNWNCFCVFFPHHLWLYLQGLAQVLHRLGGLSWCWPPPHPPFSELSSLPESPSLTDSALYYTWVCVWCFSFISRLQESRDWVSRCSYPPEHQTQPSVHRRCSFNGSRKQQTVYSSIKNIQDAYV